MFFNKESPEHSRMMLPGYMEKPEQRFAATNVLNILSAAKKSPGFFI